ncbi:MAG: hypothetical protein U0269_12970 [Polyangiales bacterium]
MRAAIVALVAAASMGCNNSNNANNGPQADHSQTSPSTSGDTASLERTDASATSDAASAAAITAEAPDPVAGAQSRFAMAAAARWPGAGGFSDVIALARAASGQRTGGSLTWVREGERTLVDARSYPINASSVRGLAALDVGGEPGDELVVFGDGVDDFGSSAGVFSLPAQRDQPLHDGARSAALDGARSLDEARSRLPLDRARTPEERAAMSNTALLGQLSLASTAELTAAVSSRGLQVCTVEAPQGQRRRERCQRYAGRALTERVVQSQLRDRLRAMFDSMTTMTFQCVTGAEQRCEAQRSGGTEIHVSIEGAAADRRISKITSIDHMIGE